MAIKKYSPSSPARRWMSVSSFEELTAKKPEKSFDADFYNCLCGLCNKCFSDFCAGKKVYRRLNIELIQRPLLGLEGGDNHH